MDEVDTVEAHSNLLRLRRVRRLSIVYLFGSMTQAGLLEYSRIVLGLVEQRLFSLLFRSAGRQQNRYYWSTTILFPVQRSEITIGLAFGMQEDSSRFREARLLPIVLIDLVAKPKILWNGGSTPRDTSGATAQTT